MAEQAANHSQSSCVVCMGPRPLLKIVPASIDPKCALEVMSIDNPTTNCSRWDEVYPLTPRTKKPPLFSSQVAEGNYTCFSMDGYRQLPTANISSCKHVVNVSENFRPKARSDLWFWCGLGSIYDSVPTNSSGICALVSLILPVTVTPVAVERLSDLALADSGRRKRSTAHWLEKGDPTYVDAIGVPRGVPDEYKIVDQVAASFESSLCPWCTINKNVDRINYIHYNVQKLGNWTQYGFEAIKEQLGASSLMAFQNRIAIDMLLAERGGEYVLFSGISAVPLYRTTQHLMDR